MSRPRLNLPRPCLQCGETFQPHWSGRKYCSRACSQQSQRLELTAERLLSRIEYDPNGGCWLWSGGLVDGYGRLGASGLANVKAYRLAYELFRGPIPDGLSVLHSCDVRACVNPAHLRTGTNLDNVLDRKSRDRGHRPQGEKSPTAKLREQDIVAIRSSPQARREIAAEFGISAGHVSRIRRRKFWSHVP